MMVGGRGEEWALLHLLLLHLLLLHLLGVLSLHRLDLLLEEQSKELVLHLLLLRRGRSTMHDALEEGRYDGVDINLLLQRGLHLLLGE